MSSFCVILVLILPLLPGGSVLPCTGTTPSSGPLHTSGSASPLRSWSQWHPAMYTSRTSLSSTPTTSTSYDGRRRLTPTGTFPGTRAWVVNSITSNLHRGRVFHRRWGLLSLRGGPRSTVNDRRPRRCEPPAERTCQLVSGRRIADLVSRLRRVGRLCVGYRAICLHPDPASQAYIMVWGPPALQNRNYHSPAYGSRSRRGGHAQRLRMARRNTDLFPPFVHVIYIFITSLLPAFDILQFSS